MMSFLPAFAAAAMIASVLSDNIDCDIVVAGGSTASLATAITAAEADPSLTVCFTEITDWPGGQMTAG
jgi:ribulose 1,5-bisphosphate synthetase/thiazole synthase